MLFDQFPSVAGGCVRAVQPIVVGLWNFPSVDLLHKTPKGEQQFVVGWLGHGVSFFFGWLPPTGPSSGRGTCTPPMSGEPGEVDPSRALVEPLQDRGLLVTDVGEDDGAVHGLADPTQRVEPGQDTGELVAAGDRRLGGVVAHLAVQAVHQVAEVGGAVPAVLDGEQDRHHHLQRGGQVVEVDGVGVDVVEVVAHGVCFLPC